jgi:hypothetical protein
MVYRSALAVCAPTRRLTITGLTELPLALLAVVLAWAYSGKRQKCGAAKGWYPATASCNRIVDPMVYPPGGGEVRSVCVWRYVWDCDAVWV